MKRAIRIRVAVEQGVEVDVVEVFMNNTLQMLAVEEEDAAVEVVELAAAMEDGVVVENRVVVEVEEYIVKRLVAIMMQIQEYQLQQSTILQKIIQTKQAVDVLAQQKAKRKQQHQNGLVV